MRRLVLRLLRLVTHNFLWKILALAIAALIWILVASEPEMATFASVPLEYKNLASDLEVSSSLLESVYLELRGPSGELRTLESHRPAVVLDMTGVRAGEHTFTIGDGNVRLPRGLRLLRSVPSQVRFDFERRAFRSIPVKVRFINEKQSDYEVAKYTVRPSELRVVGPESHMARVNGAVGDPIDLTGVIGNAEFHVNAFLEDAYVRFQDSPAVVVSVTMKKR